ncbi:hypothetical protein MMC26_001875 [Xylographa opegraphella]|nr:hypothetical protein [Xylographa opegraphella]
MHMRQLQRLWSEIVWACGLQRSNDDDNRFTLPSHTTEVIIETRQRVCAGYIWCKRADAIVGPAEVWDVAVKEVEAEILERGKKLDNQPIHVIITVDLSAMLYLWTTETQRLQLAHPKRLDVFAERDREIVEAFLDGLRSICDAGAGGSQGSYEADGGVGGAVIGQ